MGEPIPALLREYGTPWRVRDRYNLVSDASSQPPLLADNFTDPKIGTYRVCTHRESLVPANPLHWRLAPGELLSTAYSISLLYDCHTNALFYHPLRPDISYPGGWSAGMLPA